mgnify:CR=1 FL=1
MSLEVFDVRHDLKNLFVSPQIRARFMQMQPGEVSKWHSHDLGHEIFLVLKGKALFEIGDESEELEPGQLCVANVDQPHRVTVLGDEPMTMYLSVTPHVQPTHTFLDRDGERLPTRFMPSSAYDVDTDTRTPMEELINRFVGEQLHQGNATQALARTHRVQTVAVEVTQDEANALGMPTQHLGDLGALLRSGGVPQYLAAPGPDAVLGAQPIFDFRTF